jgi:hypothetical protein
MKIFRQCLRLLARVFDKTFGIGGWVPSGGNGALVQILATLPFPIHRL